MGKGRKKRTWFCVCACVCVPVFEIFFIWLKVPFLSSPSLYFVLKNKNLLVIQSPKPGNNGL